MDKGKGRALQAVNDGGVALTVTPASSAFFSGEHLVFEVKFTNTRAPRPSSSSASPAYPSRGHARAASSILASSAPASRSTFPSSTLATPTASPARSYLDLNASASGSGTSSHIVLPERRGVVGSSRAIAARTPRSTSPVHTKQLGPSRPLSPLQALTDQSQAASLYAEKRLPPARHKKNDYSIAVPDSNYGFAQEEESDEGVSDLSSQLAGQAILHERESSGETDSGSTIDARPYLEQYRLQGQAMNGRKTSYSRLGASPFSTISEEGGTADSPPKRFSPSRSLSYSSYMSTAATTPRVPSSTSAFEALDQESTPRSGSDFYGLARNDSVDSVLRDSISGLAALSRSQRQPLAHLRPPKPHGRSYSAASTPPHTAPLRSLAQSEDDGGTETLLWAFAQFTGCFTVEDALVKSGEFLAIKRSLLGAQGQRGRLDGFSGTAHVGGGTLSAEAGPDPAQGTVSGRLASWIWGAPSSKSTPQIDRRRSSAALTVDPALDASHRRSSTAGVQMPVASSPSVGSLEDRRLRAMNDDSYPVFSSPPSILAVDLVLEPGESKTYTFTLRLPGDLPPSFRGKAISFNYSFMIGTNRSPNRALGETTQQSRLVRVPVRIYNNVSVTGVRPFYDLTNPIIWHRDEAKIASEDDIPDDVLSIGKRRTRQRSGSIETAFAAARKQEEKQDFHDYATKLLEASMLAAEEEQAGSSSRNSPVPEMDRVPSFSDGGPAARPELMHRSSSHILGPTLGADGEDTSCKGAVELVSRNAQKVSYDINKDGYRIATLTLVKSAYRLGDTVNAVISLNGGAARVLRLAARLETHELIETTVSVKKAADVRQLTRRLHAEHHETTLDSGRVSFAMAIPSGATPDFATSAVKLHWTLRVSFLILPPQRSRLTSNLQDEEQRLSPRSTRSASPSVSSHPSAGGHSKSKSVYGLSSPSTPLPVETGSHHLLPVAPVSPDQQYTSYRAVPDLAFLPTLFQSQEAQAQAQQHGQVASPAIGSSGKVDEAVVLMPTKIETVEIAIPLRVYPSATPFRMGMSSFRI